ncbi:MAG: NAD-binding protein [Bacteroidetes bacterium]|nr:NAD-binding protein [Bacteroidota bacterium]
MKKNINSLHQHTIICGFGRNGREAARVLKKINTDIVIIENDSSKLNNEADNDDYLFLQADGTKDETLINAGILHAKAIITTLPDDALNVFVCLSAKELNPNIKIISRATHVSSVKKLKNAGASNVIMPDKIGGAHMAMLVNNPDIEEFIDIMSTTTGEDFLIQELTSTKEFIIGDVDCWRATGASIIGLKSLTGKFIINPAPTEKIGVGDAIIIMGSKKQIESSYTLFK